MRTRTEGVRSRAGPDDILGLRAACEEDIHVGDDVERASDLEDPSVVYASGEGYVACDGYRARPIVQAGDECESTDVAACEIGEVGVRATGGIYVCCLHIGYRSGEHGRRRRRVARSVEFPHDLGGGGICA